MDAVSLLKNGYNKIEQIATENLEKLRFGLISQKNSK